MDAREVSSMTTAYERSLAYSMCTLDAIRARLRGLPISDGTVVLVCGSYARREASQHSDVDFFVVTENTKNRSRIINDVSSTIKGITPNEPSKDGAFGGTVDPSELLENIGGDKDDNANITRRILFLLEGEWLYNEMGLAQFRRDILDRYIGSELTDRQLALFLLNDIIRYYRTVAVDYEYKTFESDNPKPWAIRNIKLVFSRKLLYASGIFSIGMTVDHARDKKIEVLEKLFGLPVVERMQTICGESSMERVLQSYNTFLSKLEDVEVRNKLICLKRSERQDPTFREIKNEGHHFTRELMKLFENTFDATHPIRRAVIF